MALPTRSALAPCQHLDRLPWGDQREVGAGYAMAMAATAAVLLYSAFVAVQTTVLAVGVLGGSSGAFLQNLPFAFLSLAVTLTAFLAPLAFLAGVVAWRVTPSSRDKAGAIGGSLATVLTYLLATVGFSLLADGGLVSAESVASSSLVESVLAVFVIAGFTFAFTAPISLPLGIVAGELYERSRSAGV